MAIASIRIKTLGNGVDPVKTSDFLKDNEKKDASVELTNIDPSKSITDLTDSFGDYLSDLGKNIKDVIKNVLNKIKSSMQWLKDAGSDLMSWLNEKVGKFLSIDMGFMGGALNLKGKTLTEIIQDCGIFGAGMKINFGLSTIAFWLYSLLAILLQLLCMGIKGVFGALMKLGEGLGIPKAAFGGALTYLIGNKGKSSGIDNIIDISSSTMDKDAHSYFQDPNKSFLDHISDDTTISRDPSDKFRKVRSSLDVLAPHWSGNKGNSLAGPTDGKNVFDGTYMVGNKALLDLSGKHNLNMVSKPNLEDEHVNSLVFTKNISLMGVKKTESIV